jgi:hypothetical protein
MCTLPLFRRDGIASVLLTHAQQWCLHNGFRFVYLSTLGHMQEAVSLYQARGFVRLSSVSGKGTAAAELSAIKTADASITNDVEPSQTSVVDKTTEKVEFYKVLADV